MGLISGSLYHAWQKWSDPYFREWLRLNRKYYKKHSETPFRVHFLGREMDITDGASFVYQFKDIFYREEYRFSCDSPGPVILDCGANTGLACLYFKKLYPEARIMAFEADPEIAQLLAGNLERNRLTGIEVIPRAVWTHGQGLDFITDGADGGHVIGPSPASAIRVPSIRLADVLDDLPQVDLLKMDIEGAEGAVLTDCGERLGRVSDLYVEYHSRSGQPQDLGDILSLLSGLGFRYHISPVSGENRHPQPPDIPPGKIDLQLHIFAHKKR